MDISSLSVGAVIAMCLWLGVRQAKEEMPPSSLFLCSVPPIVGVGAFLPDDVFVIRLDGEGRAVTNYLISTTLLAAAMPILTKQGRVRRVNKNELSDVRLAGAAGGMTAQVAVWPIGVAALALYLFVFVSGNGVNDFLATAEALITPTSNARYRLIRDSVGADLENVWVKIRAYTETWLPAWAGLLVAIGAAGSLRRRRMIFLLTYFLALAVTATPRKMSVVLTTVQFGVAYALNLRRKTRKKNEAGAVGLVFRGGLILTSALTALTVLYMQQYVELYHGVEGFFDAFTASLYRLFGVQYEALYRYVIFYPDMHPFLGGGSSPALAYLFGVEFKSDFYFILGRRLDDAEYSAPTYYVSALWADFGWWGALAGAALCGLVLRVVDAIWASERLQAGRVAFGAVAGTNLVLFAQVPMPTALLTHGILPLCAIALSVRLVLSVRLARGARLAGFDRLATGITGRRARAVIRADCAPE